MLQKDLKRCKTADWKLVRVLISLITLLIRFNPLIRLKFFIIFRVMLTKLVKPFKSFLSIFPKFPPWKTMLQERSDVGLDLRQFWGFHNISLFHTIINLEWFGNSWGKLCEQILEMMIMFCFNGMKKNLPKKSKVLKTFSPCLQYEYPVA